MDRKTLLGNVAARLLATAADIQAMLDAEGQELPPVTPTPDPAKPIWETSKLSRLTAPGQVEAPVGQNVAWVPVTADHTDGDTVLLRVARVRNASPAKINVGWEQYKYIPKEVYRWSAGDDLTHYVKITFPNETYGDGQGVIFTFEMLGAANSVFDVTVMFRKGAVHPDMPEQYHRPARKLDLSKAVRKNTFDPVTLQHSDSGFTKDGKPCWRSRLSHGYSQVGNGETGLYMNDDKFPGIAQNPVSYDPEEKAIRLHTFAAPDDKPLIHDDRIFKHQAAIIQGQTLDDVCGNAGVWRMVAKTPTRQYSWPAFWLLGRGSNGASGGYTSWPPEIDIMEQFNRVWGAAYTPFTTSCGQHYGDAGSNTRKGARGYTIETDKILGATEDNTELHSYSVALKWEDDAAWVTFFFDDQEIATQVLLARHQDMKTRLDLYPIANVAVRAISGNADSYNNDPRTGDMLVHDIAYFPEGYAFA